MLIESAEIQKYKNTSQLPSSLTTGKFGEGDGKQIQIQTQIQIQIQTHQVRLAKAMGNTVTAISTSPGKEAAAREIGADK